MRNMMITFAATLSVALPAAWQPLGAGAPEDGPATRPASKTLVTKQGIVEMTVDRTRIQPGDEVTVTLVATADEPRDIDVELWISKSDVAFESRNDTWPVIADGARVAVRAAPGGGEPKQVKFRLGEAVDEKAMFEKGGDLTRYEIGLYRARAKPLFYKGETTDDRTNAMTEIAAVAPSPLEVAIEPVRRLRVNKQATVKVRVRNTSSRTVKDLHVNLQSNQGWGEPVVPYNPDKPMIGKLRPGASRVVEFHYTPPEGVTTTDFVAYANTRAGASAAGLLTVKQSGEVVSAVNDNRAFFVMLEQGAPSPNEF